MVVNLTSTQLGLLVTYTVIDIPIILGTLFFFGVFCIFYKELTESYYVYIKTLALCHLIMIISMQAYVVKCYFLRNTTKNILHQVRINK